MTTKADIIARLPRFKSGARKGKLVNDRFKDIFRMVNFYGYSESELLMFSQEIDIYEKERLDRAELNRKYREAQKEQKLNSR